MRFRLPSVHPPHIASTFVAALIVFGLVGEAQAQFVLKWLAVGRFHKYYTETSAEHHEDAFGHNVHWPGIRAEHGNVRGYAFWMGARNFTDENGRTWSYKMAHVGPRITGAGEFFPEDFKMVSKFDPPVTRVDGFETFLRPVFNDEVDPSLPADRAIVSRTASVLGITVERRALAWGQEAHQDYHIVEYTYTNTGNTDDDDEIEIQGQTLDDVYFWFQNRYAPNRSAGWIQTPDGSQGWGKVTMNDAVGDGHEDYDVDFSAQYSWLGNVTGATRDYDTSIGGPMWNGHVDDWLLPRADSMGRLGAHNFIGKVYIHADGQAYPAETPLNARTNAVIAEGGDQPHTWNKMWTGHELTHLADHMNEGWNTQEYAYIAGEEVLNDPANKGGDTREWPHHADLALASGPDAGNRSATREEFLDGSGDPTLGRGVDGFAFTEGYGPYDIPPGQSVKIVVAEATAGLSERAEFEIGRAYKIQARGDDSFVIDYDANSNGVIDPDEQLTKNGWVMSSKDSLFQAFQRAIANYASGYNIPQPPRPPREFNVTSGVDKIEITWQPYEGAQPDHWELWRARGRYDGLAIYGGDDRDRHYDTNQFVYKCIAGCGPDEPLRLNDEDVPPLPGSAVSFDDTNNISVGLNYFYYLVAVGGVNEDPTGNTPVGVPLKSNRYYAQTYQAATLKKPPGAGLEAARIVPNPYNLRTDALVRFSIEDQLGFLDIPGLCTIRIFSELGELVKTLNHTDGSGVEYWDMQTESQQLVATGIYIASITDEATGETIYRKFVIIR